MHHDPPAPGAPDVPPRWGRLADFLIRARGLGWAFALFGVLAVAALPQLRFDFSPQTLFDRTSERAKLYQEYRATYGADDHVLFVLVKGDMATAESWGLLAELEDAVAARVPAVERTGSLASIPVPRSPAPGSVTVAPLIDRVPTDAEAAALTEAARANPLLRDTFIAGSGNVGSVFLKIADDVVGISDVRPVVMELRAILAETEAAHPNHELHLLGPHAYRVTVVDLMVEEELKFIPLTGAILILVLFLTFGSVSGVVIPLVSVFLGTVGTLALMAVTGESINIINTITATLILVIGAADAIHLIARFQHERSDGAAADDAIRRALAYVGGACLLTSVTTAAGFATLGTAHLRILRHFGAYAAMGVMLTFVVTILFVPWALARFPVPPRPDRPLLKRLGRIPENLADVALGRHRPLAVFCLAVIAFFVAGIPATTVDNFIMEYVPDDDPIREGHRLLEDELAGIVYLDVLLEVPEEAGGEDPWHDPALLRRAAEIEAVILQDEFIHATDSVLTLLREIRWVQRGGEGSSEPRDALPSSRKETASLLLLAELSGERTALNTHLDARRRILRLTFRADDLGARNYLALEKRMRTWIDERTVDSPVPIVGRITGTSQVGYGGIDSLIRDLLTSLGYAFLIIFVTLALLFRDWRIAALAMIPNCLPIVVVLGGMGWAGRHLETLSAMVFSIGLGIAVDDTIHYLARYCQEVRRGATPEQAVRITGRRTGRPIIYTSLLLLAGFGVLYTSRFPPNQMFAVLASIVIAAALFADLVLLPALLLWIRPRVPGARSTVSGSGAQDPVGATQTPG